MRVADDRHMVLLAAAYLRVPSRRLRALARGQDDALHEWVAGESARPQAHARHQARDAIAALERIGATLVTIADPAYPPGLLDLDEPPPFLCVRGTLPRSGIAIIGNRTAAADALEFARELASRCREPVVSGLAAGIDAAAHRGAIEAGNPTIAYIGTGITITYPPEHRALEEEIVKSGGAIASERLIDEPASKVTLVHRDRLQAAHAGAVVLASSEIDGGAMQTMRFAKELGRPRFALRPARGMERQSEYAGNMQAIADGAVALPLEVDKALRLLARTTSSK